MPKCKSCGAEIIWGTTGKRRIPLDVKTENRFIVLDYTDGVPLVSIRITYQTHFSTCPNASDHRKTKGK